MYLSKSNSISSSTSIPTTAISTTDVDDKLNNGKGIALMRKLLVLQF